TELAPFRILTGIEVDILEDGALDQDGDLLGQLDVVVASVHSSLRMPAGPMTDRMVAAVSSPPVDVLGPCTGRLLPGPGPAAAGRGDGLWVGRRCSRPAGTRGSRSRSTAGPNAGTRPAGCCAWPSRPAACSRSIPTRTRPASSTGSATAAPGPRKPASIRAG